MIHKSSKGIEGNPYDLEKIWKIDPPRCPKNTFQKAFHPLKKELVSTH